MSQKNKKQKNRPENNHQVSKEKLLPKVFLKKMGITPFADEEHNLSKQCVANEIGKHFGQKEFDKYNHTKVADMYDYMFSKIFLAKLWYRADYYLFCTVTTELKDITVPSASKILDIGGGPGLLAFYMAEIWTDSEITVADRYSNLGTQWAQEISASRVFFKDSILPDLKNIPDQYYDVIVLSRVLGSTDDLDLPTCISASWEIYSVSPEGTHLLTELNKIANSLKRVMKPDGQIIVIDSWSGDRVLLIGRAFEKEGLFIDVARCNPDHLSINYSIITFSRSSLVAGVNDLPLALSTKVDEEKNGVLFKDIAADALKNLFHDKPPVMEFEYVTDEQGNTMRTEIFEKDGLALSFNKHSEGRKIAGIFSAADIPKHVKNYTDFEKETTAEGNHKIIQGVTLRN